MVVYYLSLQREQYANTIGRDNCKICKGRGWHSFSTYDGHRTDTEQIVCADCERSSKMKEPEAKAIARENVALVLTDYTGIWEHLYVNNVQIDSGHHVRDLAESIIQHKVTRLVRVGVEGSGDNPSCLDPKYRVHYDDEPQEYFDFPESLTPEEWLELTTVT